jgi:hypothetical protein
MLRPSRLATDELAGSAMPCRQRDPRLMEADAVTALIIAAIAGCEGPGSLRGPHHPIRVKPGRSTRGGAAHAPATEPALALLLSHVTRSVG